MRVADRQRVKIVSLHQWPRTARPAMALQRELAGRVETVSIRRGVRVLAGVDAAFSPDGSRVIAGVVVWDLRTRAVIERHVARTPCTFPYVPGLLSFRELPGVLAAFRAIQTPIDAVLCDAQGLAHPRRFGLACHLGLWLQVPTIGCAKSRLCGTYREPAPSRGCATRLINAGETVGKVVRTRAGVKPLFVSQGHLSDTDSAVRLTLQAAICYRLPEPTRLAHQLVTRERKK